MKRKKKKKEIVERNEKEKEKKKKKRNQPRQPTERINEFDGMQLYLGWRWAVTNCCGSKFRARRRGVSARGFDPTGRQRRFANQTSRGNIF